MSRPSNMISTRDGGRRLAECGGRRRIGCNAATQCERSRLFGRGVVDARQKPRGARAPRPVRRWLASGVHGHRQVRG
eukprot:626402-Pleurochrysis_carterae.AAC.1